MSREVRSSSGGIGFTGVLTIVFVVLKLVGVINWSWWWVLSPLWISFGLFLLIMIGVIIYAVCQIKKDGSGKWKERRGKWKR